MNTFRLGFITIWEGLNSNLKSLLISLGAIILAVFFLFAAQRLFPGTDFSEVQAVVITAISGFIVSLVKNWVRNE